MRTMMSTVIATLLFLAGCGGNGVSTAVSLAIKADLKQLSGKWYEIARYPNAFQKDCVAVTAEYVLEDDGDITLVNRFRKGDLDGKQREVRASAEVIDPETNARLKVTFFGLFQSEYWIIDLDQEYDWAVIGDPTGKLLWVLSRGPTLEPSVYEDICKRLSKNDRDPSRLFKTPQPTDDSAPGR